MKRSIVKHSAAAIILVGLLVTMHLQVHYSVFSGRSFYPFESYTDTPVQFHPLELCEVKQPNYLNPVRKVQFSYRNVEAETDDCTIIERAQSHFSSDVESVQDDVKNYWGGFDEDGFVHGYASHYYPNIFFFLVQYALIIALLTVLFKGLKEVKKNQ